jgi:thiol-disulfide isomerase/thioredoxin
MMKRISALALLLLSAAALHAQGISFEEGDWASVLSKARAQNRLVYVDVYTTWCGPCKLLATNIFPKKEAGDYYNANFVNYRIDAEKGEGVTIAQQYHVTGYPTHLFIDPANSTVVYRGMGYEPEVGQFVHEGEVAGLEWKDPMTWDKYTEQFPGKKNDKAFLRSYLRKSARLSKDNSAILDAYIALLDKNHLPDSEVIFVADNIRTIDNGAVALVMSRSNVLKKRFPDQKDYVAQLNDRWIFATLEKATQTKDESLLPRIEAALKALKPKEAEEEILNFRTRFYSETGNQEAAIKAASAEADFLSKKSSAQYKAADEEAIGSIKEQIRWQLKEMKVPEEKWVVSQFEC